MEEKSVVKVAIDGIWHEAQPEELLINLINRTGGSVPQVCYHPQLGPIQTCDTCMIEVNGKLARATKTACVVWLQPLTFCRPLDVTCMH